MLRIWRFRVVVVEGDEIAPCVTEAAVEVLVLRKLEGGRGGVA